MSKGKRRKENCRKKRKKYIHISSFPFDIIQVKPYIHLYIPLKENMCIYFILFAIIHLRHID